MASKTFNITRADLGSYDGETVGWLILHGITTADLSSAMNYVSDVSDDELTGGSYARGTIDLIVDQVGDQAVLTRDPGSSMPLADTSDSEDPTVVVLYDPAGGSDAARKLIFAGDVDEAPGFVDWPIDTSAGIAIVAEGTSSGGASTDAALDVTATATYAKSATAGAAIETDLVTLGVSADRAATERAITEGFLVTAAGDTQDEVNDNLSQLAGYGVSRGVLAETRALEGLTLAALGDLLEAAITVPTAFLRCGYGEGAYGATASRGFWRCPTRVASPTTTYEYRDLRRTVKLPSKGNTNQFQEGLSECLDAGVGALDRKEPAVNATDGFPRPYWEKTASGGTEEDVIFTAGALPIGTWFEWRVVHTLTTNVVKLQVRCDAFFDDTAGDGTTWLTLGTKDFGASTTIAASTYAYQWLGRGAGEFDIARAREWADGVLVVDVNPAAAGAGEGDTTFEDQVLESSPGTPAVWTAQDQADVGEETVATGAGDVTGPSSSTDGHAVVFDGTSGKAIKTAGAAPVLATRLLAGLDLSADRTAAALRTALGFKSVILASDVPSNVSPSGTTPVDITTHSVSYVNGDKIALNAEEFYTGDAAADIRIGATFTNATVILDVEGVDQAASSFPANRAVRGTITSTGGYVELGCQTGGTQRASVRGSLIATGTGTLQLTVAQRSNNATATTIKAGSVFRAEASS